MPMELYSIQDKTTVTIAARHIVGFGYLEDYPDITVVQMVHRNRPYTVLMSYAYFDEEYRKQLKKEIKGK